MITAFEFKNRPLTRRVPKPFPATKTAHRSAHGQSPWGEFSVWMYRKPGIVSGILIFHGIKLSLRDIYIYIFRCLKQTQVSISINLCHRHWTIRNFYERTMMKRSGSFRRIMPNLAFWKDQGYFLSNGVTNGNMNNLGSFSQCSKVLRGHLFPEQQWTQGKLDTIIGVVVLLNSVTMIMELECEGAVFGGDVFLLRNGRFDFPKMFI